MNSEQHARAPQTLPAPASAEAEAEHNSSEAPVDTFPLEILNRAERDTGDNSNPMQEGRVDRIDAQSDGTQSDGTQGDGTQGDGTQGDGTQGDRDGVTVCMDKIEAFFSNLHKGIIEAFPSKLGEPICAKCRPIYNWLLQYPAVYWTLAIVEYGLKQIKRTYRFVKSPVEMFIILLVARVLASFLVSQKNSTG